MERYNWWKGKHAGLFASDARLPASMIGLARLPLGVGNLPLDQLTSVWTEPPYATIGLGTGTMSSYARCFQHMTFYEIDENIRNFSLPPNDKYIWRGPDGKANDPFFTFVYDAIQRGTNLEVVMGDARQSLQQENPDVSALYSTKKNKEDFYTKHAIPNAAFSKREKYYKVIEVDAFSSDAIPIHLITKEATLRCI